MKLALITSGRFHLADLARELLALGVDVTFYSLLPPARTDALGLPRGACRWLWPALPAFALARAWPSQPYVARAAAEAVDLAAAAVLEPCDAALAMGGMSLRSLARARALGAVTYVERASKHLRAQKRILDAVTRSPSRLPERIVRRDEREYAAADYVSVPARHAAASFVAEGFPARRLVVNPFGTDLTAFAPTPSPPLDPPRLVTAGAWSLNKGADVLADAFARLRRRMPRVELHHVGPRGDVPLPRALPGFTHEDTVPQPALAARYARAHAFVLASRQDGLAVVQAQALACGLPLVCTAESGGVDLGALVDAPPFVAATGDAEALCDALEAALAWARAHGRLALGERRAALSWRAYAERWRAELERACAARVRP